MRTKKKPQKSTNQKQSPERKNKDNKKENAKLALTEKRLFYFKSAKGTTESLLYTTSYVPPSKLEE